MHLLVKPDENKSASLSVINKNQILETGKCQTLHFALLFTLLSPSCFPPLPQLVSLLLVGVAAWGKWFGLVSSIRVVAGVIGVGIFLFLVALVGLCGALKHHQVLLFFVSFTFRRSF